MGRLLVMFCCLLAGHANAGAWPRAAGTGFASAGVWHAVDDTDSYATLFAEYGLLPRLTIGLDAGRSVSGQTKAVVFLRAPLGRTLGLLTAGEIGLGEIAGQPVLRPGLSFGHEISTRMGQGWLSVDTLLEADLETRRLDLKADITLGFTPHVMTGQAEAPPSGWTLMLQLQTGLVDLHESLLQLQTEGIVPEPSFLRLAPSVTYRINDRTRLEFGFYRGLRDTRERGLKFGVWTTF